jgi:hypothetical protein
MNEIKIGQDIIALPTKITESDFCEFINAVIFVVFFETFKFYESVFRPQYTHERSERKKQKPLPFNLMQSTLKITLIDPV